MAKPGSSKRTPAKHDVWNKILGKEIGAAEFTPFRCRRLCIVELTAGDGAATYGDTASPVISAKHGLHRSGRQNTPRIDIYLYEKASNTYKTLLMEMNRQLPSLTNPKSDQRYHLRDGGVWQSTDERTRIFILNEDGKNMLYPAEQETWYLINNDPNVITQWVLDARVLMPAIACGSRILIYSAMGCNAGGVKRGPAEERPKWHAYVQHVIEVTKALKTVDLLLAAIEKDASQWAYLAMTPRKWMDGRRETFRKSFNEYGLSVACYSLFTEEANFFDLLKHLFDNH